MADKFKACSVDGCNGNSHTSKLGARGYCNKHYKRLLRHGSPTMGGTPIGEPNKYFEDVVIPFYGDECLSWPYSTNGVGYGTLNGKYVHRLACERASGPPPTPKHEASHLCGNGHLRCVNPRHLAWKTRSENHADKINHGTHSRGERHYSCKLKEAQVREILSLKGKETQAVIAKKFGIGQTTVSHIMRRDSWGWLS
jgi:hypothetical protein